VIEIRIDKKSSDRLNKLLGTVPDEVAFAVYDKALPAAGRVVQKRAKENAPRSARNAKGGREKMSKKSQAAWTSIPLADLIIVKIIGKGKKAGAPPMALVGPKYPEGNKGNFVHPMKQTTKRQVLWGKATMVGRQPKDNDFLKRAGDETRPQQISAFTREVIKQLRKLRVAK